MATVPVQVGLTSGRLVFTRLTPDEVDGLVRWLTVGKSAVKSFRSAGVHLVREHVTHVICGEVDDDG